VSSSLPLTSHSLTRCGSPRGRCGIASRTRSCQTCSRLGIWNWRGPKTTSMTAGELCVGKCDTRRPRSNTASAALTGNELANAIVMAPNEALRVAPGPTTRTRTDTQRVGGRHEATSRRGQRGSDSPQQPKVSGQRSHTVHGHSEVLHEHEEARLVARQGLLARLCVHTSRPENTRTHSYTHRARQADHSGVRER
jgi:hypothetical protein